MITTRTLTASDFDALHAAFVEAFSDYVVKLAPTREQLAEMLARRGWIPEASVAAFDGERMVAFTVNAIDGDSGYDSGTGVVPSHRRRGLARRLMDESCELLRARGCTRYVLEVIDANASAYALYRACGFTLVRGLQCWTFASDVSADAPRIASCARLDEERDIAPSWQNSDASLARTRDPRVILGDDDACAIVFPSNGDLPRLVVRRDARRRGRGTQLLRAAHASAGKPLRIMNVDERDRGIATFLEAAGARPLIRQLELVCVL
ncbi:MAG: GNAT family N-acetyltransferase [Acidobacteria bacterium]|nr:GNAT family N-acetyltransferase [Acidobacteriota bacterium]MBV9477622.1 GNAT family N-acetyltransferase [Acidobacteriota bacterium]